MGNLNAYMNVTVTLNFYTLQLTATRPMETIRKDLENVHRTL